MNDTLGKYKDDMKTFAHHVKEDAEMIAKNSMGAISQKAEEGMIVHTNTPNVVDARRVILELIISNHKVECLCTNEYS